MAAASEFISIVLSVLMALMHAMFGSLCACLNGHRLDLQSHTNYVSASFTSFDC